MTRASISISPPNDKWIQPQIESEASGPSTKSPDDIINAVIEKRRKNGSL